MSVLEWILISTFSMSLFSFVGVFTLVLKEDLLKKIILPLVSLSAGALLGGAFLHMIPEAIEAMGNSQTLWLWVILGFSLFFLMEQFIHWHHCHKAPTEHKTPVTYLILIADGLHNFIGGLAIAGAFLVDIRVGIITWLACAAHEIPQEFGDFGILIHGGWTKSKALWFNFFSGLTMVLGALIAYYFSGNYDVRFLLPFAAGNFIYIAASDLIPEVKHSQDIKTNIVHFASFIAGVILILSVRIIFE
ncbi:MAG: ZIP family metal transporter [Candidatus Pacebacteria bacterium]|jgi:zinc and cadmium transporter|nr:ZIP family metal transporter [Candidatus Paceibacterota bacterium]